MRIISAPILLFGLVGADCCGDLCVRDGPSVCTNGSWTKSNGDCHGYLFKGDPKDGEYCYHTKETAWVCPSTGTPVKAVDVERLLNPTTSTPGPIVRAEGPDYIRVHQDSPLRSLLLALPASKASLVSSELSGDHENLLSDLLSLNRFGSFPISETLTEADYFLINGARSISGLLDCGNHIGSYRFEAPLSVEFNDDWPERLCSLMIAVQAQFLL
jgi:hypothetical protein